MYYLIYFHSSSYRVIDSNLSIPPGVTEVQNTVLTDSLLRCHTHHPYDERDSFLLQLLFQHRLLIWYGRPSPVLDHPFSSASNLLFIAVAMVVSWSRRVLFLFSLLLLSLIVVSAASVRWSIRFFVFSKNCKHLIRKSYFYVQSQ